MFLYSSLYEEMEPHTETRPLFLICAMTALLSVPPTCNIFEDYSVTDLKQ
jgi:hypothetical protein